MKLVSHLGARLAAAGLAGALAFAAPASATTITVTNVAVPYSEAVTLTGGTIPTSPENVGIAGQIVLTTSIGTLYTWCVDLFHTISLGNNTYTYTTGPLQTMNNGTSPGTSTPLETAQILRIEELAAYGTALLPTLATADKSHWSAVVQSAIWQVEYGTVATNSSDTAFAKDLTSLMAMALPQPANPGYQLYDQDGQGLFLAQGLYVPPPPPGSGIEGSVPEPATLALLGLGLAGLGFGKRKKA